MQSKSNNVHLGQSINLLNEVVNVLSVDNSFDLQDVFAKIDKFEKIWDDRKMDFDLIRYLSGMAKISRQNQIYNALLKKAYASPTWPNMKSFEFNFILAANTTANFAFPYKQKRNNVANDNDATLITVNSFFVCNF